MNVKAVTAKELDGWTKGAPMAIHGACHPRSEQLVFYMGGLVAIRCRTCNRHVVNIAVNETTHEEITARLMVAPIGDDPVRLKPGCHPKAGLHLAYNDGDVEAVCGKCKEEVTTLHVRPAPAGEA